MLKLSMCSKNESTKIEEIDKNMLNCEFIDTNRIQNSLKSCELIDQTKSASLTSENQISINSNEIEILKSSVSSEIEFGASASSLIHYFEEFTKNKKIKCLGAPVSNIKNIFVEKVRNKII